MTRLLFLLLLLEVALAGKAGFSTTLTESGLGLIEDFGRSTLASYLSSANQYSFSAETDAVTLELSNTIVTDHDHNYKLHVAYQTDHGIRITLEGLSFSLRSDYVVSIWLFWNTGVVEAKVTQAQVQALMTTKTTDGRLKPEIEDCQFSVENIEIEFHGGLINHLMNMFRSSLANKVSSFVKERFCAYFRDKLMGSVQDNFLRVKDYTWLFDNFYMNYSVTSEPLFGATFLQLEHDGSVFAKMEQSEQFDNENPFRNDAESNFAPRQERMINIQLSPWIVKSLVYYIYKYNKIDMDFNPDNLPPDFAPYFRTTCEDVCAGVLFPVLAEKHPNTSLAIEFKVHETPNVTLEQGAIRVDGILNFTGILFDSKEQIFHGLAYILINIHDFTFVNRSLVAEISVKDFGIREFHSVYPEVEAEDFSAVLDYASADFIEPRLTDLLGNGIVIPKAGPFLLEQGQVEIDGNMVTLSADFVFQ